MAILDELPFPFSKPEGQQLWRVMAGMFPVPFDAIAFAEPFGVDPLNLIPNLTPRQLWHVLLETTAIEGTTRDLVTAALARSPRGPHAAFLTEVLAGNPVSVSAEPVDDFDPTVTQPEALLFTDDLTIPAGRVPALIDTLQCLHALAPAVCLLRVDNALGSFLGTGFKIAADLVLTNEHVLFPERQKATQVHVDFGFDVDRSGVSLPVASLAGDPASIQGDRADDWAVVRVAGMDAALPVIPLSGALVPGVGARAYIVQHPNGQQKRLGFVRNTISSVGDQYVQYLTDTQPGSSGAPVFDENGNLIALHHRGGTPTQQIGKMPLTKNQGIRISRVLTGLKAKGLVH